MNVYSASKPLQQVKIADPYIEMHTGPGGGYPIFHVIERGSFIEIIVRQANWYKVRGPKNKEGWVAFEQLSRTLNTSGDVIEFETITQEDFTDRDWEWGAMAGTYGGAPALSVYGSYLFNQGLATEVSIAQSIGDLSSSILVKIGLVMQPFPEWKYSPYFQMSTGIVDVTPSSITITPINPKSQFANIGLGVRAHITQKIILRLEYAQYTVFSSSKDNDNNEDTKEWKVGFAVFF